MKLLLIGILVVRCGIATVQGKEHLLLVVGRPNIAAGKQISMDVYLYNDSSKAVKVPSLEYLTAEWLLDDTRGRRMGRAGGSTRITGAGTPKVLVPARAMLHRNIKVAVKAETGDVATVKVTLGGQREIESNGVLLYCSTEKK